MRWIYLFLLLCVGGLHCKQPQLTPKDVRLKVDEILKAHVSHKSLSSELMRRSISNFLEELDPAKTYFIENEVLTWLEPSQEMLEAALRGFHKGDFSLFREIHGVFLEAIKRRGVLEADITETPLVLGVKSEEFKDLSWAKNEEELKGRLHRIRSLQSEAVGKLDAEMRGTFFQRLEKRRMHREAEFSEPQEEERSRLILSCVLKSVTSSLDMHTNYFTPSEASQLMIHIQQRLFGIGAELRDDLDGLSVRRILENGPASQSNKLKIHDKIIAVGHEPVVGMEITEAVELIRGEKGTPVVLTILRTSEENGETVVDRLEVELVRNEVILEENRLETMYEPFGDGVIAHLKLFSFYEDAKYSSGSDVRKAIEEIQKDHLIKGVILDLRGNGGGLLKQAVAVSGLFMNKGIVVSVQDSAGKLQHLREIEGNPVWTGPLLVLVNRASASASEIVAQTLQDYGRAIVIGDECTYGKGSFQESTLGAMSQHKVNPQGEYKVTRGRYYTVSGKSPQLVGVSSDIVVPGILSFAEIGEKYGKYPLDTDQIEAHFSDDLSDLSLFYRFQLGSAYLEDLQQKVDVYSRYMEKLKKNSNKRIQNNKNYQSFIAEIEKKNFDAEIVNVSMQIDFQSVEALNVMRDLLFFMETEI